MPDDITIDPKTTLYIAVPCVDGKLQQDTAMSMLRTAHLLWEVGSKWRGIGCD